MTHQKGFIVLDMQAMDSTTLMKRLPIYQRWMHRQTIQAHSPIDWQVMMILPRLPYTAFSTPGMAQACVAYQQTLRQIQQEVNEYFKPLAITHTQVGRAGLRYYWQDCESPLVLWEHSKLRRLQHMGHVWYGRIRRLFSFPNSRDIHHTHQPQSEAASKMMMARR